MGQNGGLGTALRLGRSWAVLFSAVLGPARSARAKWPAISQGATADTGVPPEDQHMEMQMASAGAGEHAGKPKVICGRYFQKDHATADCTNDVYCYICDGHDHVNHRCPVLKLGGLLGGGAGLPSHTTCSSASEGGVHDCPGDSCRRSHL